MGRHVDGHAVDPDREIGAVVEVEAAQEILVGFALAGMLGDDQAGHDLQRLAGPQEGHGIHLRAADAHGAGGGGLQGSGAIGRSAGRDAAGARGDRLVRANGGSAPRTRFCDGFGRATRFGRGFRARDGDRRKLVNWTARRVPAPRRGARRRQTKRWWKIPATRPYALPCPRMFTATVRERLHHTPTRHASR